jgi:hypothetical protein
MRSALPQAEEVNDNYENLEDVKSSSRVLYYRRGDGHSHGKKETKKRLYNKKKIRKNKGKRHLESKIKPHGTDDRQAHINEFGDLVAGPAPTIIHCPPLDPPPPTYRSLFHKPSPTQAEKMFKLLQNKELNSDDIIGPEPTIVHCPPLGDDDYSYEEDEGFVETGTEFFARIPLEETKDSYTDSDYVDRDLRNELVRLAESTPAMEVDESEQLRSLLDTVSVAPALLGDESDEANQWISYLENIVILGWHIHKATTFADVFVSIIGYIKMHTNRSIVRDIVQMIDSLTKDCNATTVLPHGLDSSTIVDKWDMFKTNIIFTKISYLITAAMSMTVCSVKQITWSPFGLQLLALEAAKEQLKCVDVIDAIIHTFTWICETGYRVFQEKSLLPLLYSDSRTQKFNEECDYIISHSEVVLSGNTENNMQDFEHRVDQAIITVAQLKAAKVNGPTSIWLQQKYSILVDIKYKIVARYKNTAIRVQPFGVGLTGPSGVGKSTLAKIVMKTALHAMDYDTDPTRIITKDMFDKYDSTYTSDILGMFMDDVGNGKPDFTVNSPTDIIIKFFNNMAAQAVKAELNQKGIVFINFKVGIITSNFKNYQVGLYTDKPEAALRRFIHTRVNVKPEFRVPGGLSLDTNSDLIDSTQLCQDIWNLSIEEVFIYETGNKETYKFRPAKAVVNGVRIECTNLGLDDYLSAIIYLAKKHKLRQDNVVKRCEEFDSMKMCGKCSKPITLCKCVKTAIVPHAFEDLGEIVVNATKKSVLKYVRKWINPVSYFSDWFGYKPLKSLATNQLAREFTHALNTNCTPYLISLTPKFLFETSLFQKGISLWQHSAVMYDIRKPMRAGCFMSLLMLALSCYKKSYCMGAGTFSLSWVFAMMMWTHYRARVKALETEYLSRRDALPALISETNKDYIAKGTFMVAALVIGLKMFKLWNDGRIANIKKIDPAGNISAESMDTNPGWFGFMMSKVGVKVGVQPGVKHSNPTHVVSSLKKNNLFWADFKRSDDSKARCNIFFPRKGVAWFPQHMFYPNCDFSKEPCSFLEVTVHRHKDVGGMFTFKTEMSQCSTDPSLDLVCAYVPNCPDLPSKLKWLPTTLPVGTSSCTFVVRKGDEFLQDNINVDHCKTGHKYREFYGGTYGTNLAEKGACMGTLVLDQASPVIIGFHIGGNPDHKLWSGSLGVMQTITLEMANGLISRLSKIPGVILSTESGVLPATQYGRVVLESKDVHPHSMAAKLTEKDYIEVFGSTRLRTQQKSTVGPSILSDAVSSVTGVQNQWAGPKLMPNWEAYNKTLEHIVNPADMFIPSKLERSRQDWLAPLKVIMRTYKKKYDFRILTDKEAVLGIDGVHFIDPLNMSTGMGFPIFGPKNKHFVEVRDGQKLLDRIPSDEIKTEMNRLLECWKRNERGYPITSATLKDEPTVIGVTKVRVFQAFPVAFSILVRKYFLPIARFLSLHPELSECAVGVNAFSDQWDGLMSHAEKFSEDEAIAWDYSKYDVRMSSQITRAVLLSYIELAEIGGYEKIDLVIMFCIVNDMVHPLIDYNGTLIMSYNMNTSGNNITVNINSTAGSLYVRMGFFDEYPDAKNFRDHVAAMTYGDDFKGSVAEGYRKFNYHSFKLYLSKFKMKITPPDKREDDIPDFMDIADTDFLKRQSQYIPEIGTRIGKLDEMSIFKSLHSNQKSKNVTDREVATSCIEGAMHEWFAHGRDVYDLRSAQMTEVCKLVDLPVPATRVTFDERVKHWLEKYVITA